MAKDTTRTNTPLYARLMLALLFLCAGTSFYLGVLRAPVFDSNRPYTGDFGVLFSIADTHLTAARVLIDDRNAALRDPSLGKPPPIDAALEQINLSLKQRPANAYAWVMKAQQELIVARHTQDEAGFERAIEAWRTSNRLASNAINLTGPRLMLAARLWRRLDEPARIEISRQVAASWFDQGPRPLLARLTARSVRARRIVSTALQDDPVKLAEFEAMLHQAKLSRKRQR